MSITTSEQNDRSNTGYFPKIILLVTIFCCIIFYDASAQNNAPGNVVKHDSALTCPGYVLFAPLSTTTTYLIDKAGNIIHRWDNLSSPAMSVYLLPDGNLLRAEKDTNPKEQYGPFQGGIISIYKWQKGKAYSSKQTPAWTYKLCNDSIYQSHDIYPMPNGNILVDAWEKIDTALARKMGMKDSILKNINKPYILSAMVIELKPGLNNSAKIVWQWRFRDHLDSTGTNTQLLNINYTGTPCCGLTNDWIHMNAVTYNEKLDQVMVSSRNLNEIYIIDHSTTTQQAAGHTGGKHGMGGDFLYRWGNPHAYGQKGTQQLFGQHSPYWIPENYPGGNLIMINNDGYGRSYTSADILNPPVDGSGNYIRSADSAFGPCKAAWTYKDPIYSNLMGNAQRLPNGNTLVCAALNGVFYEVDVDGHVVWEYDLAPQEEAFRCTQYPYSYLKPALVPEHGRQNKQNHSSKLD